MHIHSFLITLEQDVIVSSRNATAGEPEALDYLPGSVFLGVAAARLYHKLSQREAWQVFHSGRIRFGDGLPCADNGSPAWPMPLALHHYKGESATLRAENAAVTRLDSRALFDPSINALAEGRQPVQLRGGYLSAAGEWVRPVKTLHMKTAMDAASGRAAESQLFAYQALSAGQKYVFNIECDDDPNLGDLFARLRTVFSGKLRLGRSRSAEFGRVRVEPLQLEQGLEPRSDGSTDNNLTLWLLSDLMISNELGQSTLQPEPELLGLPAGTRWLDGDSFLRSRRYSPYNAKRAAYDPSREVISRGSVLRYSLPQGSGETALLEGLRRIGGGQVSGLGRVAVNPLLLSGTVQLRFHAPAAASSNAVALAPVSMDTPLARLLERRTKRADDSVTSKTADEIFEALLKALVQARAWNGYRAGAALSLAPGRSQWGRIKQEASDRRSDHEALWRVMFEDTNCVVGKRSGWELELSSGSTFGDRFRKLMADHRDRDLPELLGRIAAKGLTNTWENAVEGERARRGDAA